jgi:glutathione synthase/RimK-type ligase-like ATP-grasp enzyme
VYEPPAELADLAQRMVGSLGGGLMGVDVLVEPSGRLLALEANAPFGFDVTDPEQGRWVARAALGRL